MMKTKVPVIIEKYETFLKYMDNVLQNIPSARANLRNDTEQLLLRQVGYLYLAVKSGTPSRLYQADVGLDEIRFRLRFLSNAKYNRRVERSDGSKVWRSTWLVKKKTACQAELLLSEVGRILGDMINKVK